MSATANVPKWERCLGCGLLVRWRRGYWHTATGRIQCSGAIVVAPKQGWNAHSPVRI